MTGYIDTHCHLDLPHFDADREDVVKRAIAAGVDLIVNPGIDLASCLRIIKLTKEFSVIKAAIGIHPNDLKDNFQSDLTEFRRILHNENVLAIGEIGLDNYHKQVPIELQIRGLRAQLDLADEFNLPVIIHSREALIQITPILSEWSDQRRKAGIRTPIGVMHSFEGNLTEARQFIDLGFMVGISGPVTYKNAYHKIDIAREIPLESLVLETDSPYLTPVPFRGQRNEPAFLPQIGQRTAIIRMSKEELILEQTSRNAFALFLLE